LRIFWYNSIKEITPKLKEYRSQKERQIDNSLAVG
jgi:hypothetical protein